MPRSMLSLAARMAYDAAPANWPRPGQRLVVHRLGRHHLVDQADRERLVGLHEPAGEDQVLGLAGPDQPGQPLGAAGAGDDAEQDLGLAQHRVVGRDPDVGAQRELAAAAERVAGDRGDDRLRDPRHGGERRLQRAGALDHVGVRHVGHLLDVRARGEDPLAAVHDDGLDVVALGGLGRGRPDLLLDLHVEGIHLRPVEPDRADAVGDLQSYELAHAATRLSHRPACPRSVSGIVPPSGTMARVTPGLWRNRGERAPVWPGRNWPLGSTWSAVSTNFAVHAPRATAVWVCLFDEEGGEQQHRLTEQALGIWHGAIPDVAPGTRYGYRIAGPWDPEQGLRFNVNKLLLDPFAKAISGEVTVDPAIFGYHLDDPTDDGHRRLRAVRPAQRGAGRGRLRLGRRQAVAAPVARQRDLRGARQGHDLAPRPGSRGAARHLRRAGDPRGRRVPQGPGHHRGRAAADPPVHQRAVAGRARIGQLLGLQLDRLLRPAQRLLRLRRPRPAGHRVQDDGQGVPRRRHRGDPRRRLQPHRRGRRRWARRSRSAGSTTAASTAGSATTRSARRSTTPTGTSPAAATPSTPPTRSRSG